ncbi:MAG: prepilin-type N-terminal cleavage/methylation domain-containing protein [Planctomycetes bacterium]|nr:prepilin-type N-terminal cleavage/methylation domain-containing protein [Planctomycetota bacterium]
MNRPMERQGFTLIELLVVITIIGILGALGMTMMASSKRKAEDLECGAMVQTLGASLEQYKNDRRHGAYPATSLEGHPGLPKLGNRSNMGIEALFVALESKDYRGDHPSESIGDKFFKNTDEDLAPKSLTLYGAADLFEYVDPWDNPFAYFSAADYGNLDVRQYYVAEGGSGIYEPVTVKPWINEKTKSPFNPTTYQIFSAGRDGIFNTEDDIGNW